MKSYTHPNIEEISLTNVMQALSDPCRMTIVKTLLDNDGLGLACKEFDLHVSKATASHHFEVLRAAGLTSTQCEGTRCITLLREDELNRRFPALLDLIANELH